MTKVTVYKFREEKMVDYVTETLRFVCKASVQQVTSRSFTTSASPEDVKAAVQFAKWIKNKSVAEIERLMNAK